jgi:hypothetical protein
MLKEDYCSFEVAKLLKEKGFDEECFALYNPDGMLIQSGIRLNNIQVGRVEGSYSAPTLQMAMKWLRKEHQLHISVDVSPIYGKVKDEKGRNTCGLLYWHYMASGEWVNEKYNPNQKAFIVSVKSYEDAVEEALKFTLEKLI